MLGFAKQEREKVQREQQEAAARRPAPTPPPTPPVTVSHPQGINDVLACIRAHESDTAGGYSAQNPVSSASGAYQMLDSTASNVAQMMGRPDLVGVPAKYWSPADQDAGARLLYSVSPSAWRGTGCPGTG